MSEVNQTTTAAHNEKLNHNGSHVKNEPDLSAFHDVNPINPKGQEGLPTATLGTGLPGIRRPDSPDDPPPGPPKYAETQSPAINRPPKPPGDYLGPYIQFITTKDTTWFASVLLLRRRSLAKPQFSLQADTEARINEPQWETLYEDVFGMTAWRLNLEVEMLPGEGDTTISWKVVWPHEDKDHYLEEGQIAVPRLDAQWRGGFLSCNGFDATVPVSLAESLTYTNVWSHLGSVHKETPLNLLIWGGDQNYIDFIFEDIPFLKRWIEMEWNVRWQHEFSAKTEAEVSEYHFNTYCENWERPEVKIALANVPALMSWDDHDIFDGAGSYPALLHDSPVMSGLFLCAQRYRLLFQHHTTPDLARKHRLFGKKGHNFISQCGPRLAVLLTDGRSERTIDTVQDKETWGQIFEKLDKDLPPSTQHLLAVFAVPLSFVRIRIAERVFSMLVKLPNKYRQLPLLKSTNSLFGLPELYDDLLDEWTHDAHIEERNAAIANFQKFAKARSCRVTFLSGDVHCAGMSRFRTPPKGIKPVNDPNMMYQVIASAIVNMPPPRNALRFIHYSTTKWTPLANTEEELLNFFERMPEGGRKLRHRKLLPNRNWCYFESVSPSTPSTPISQVKSNGNATPNVNGNGKVVAHETQTKEDFWRNHYAFTKKDPYPTTLGPTSNEHGTGSQHARLHEHSGGLFCRHEKGYIGAAVGKGVEGDLRIRLWLESSLKSDKGRRFASYDVVVPPLEV